MFFKLVLVSAVAIQALSMSILKSNVKRDQKQLQPCQENQICHEVPNSKYEAPPLVHCLCTGGKRCPMDTSLAHKTTGSGDTLMYLFRCI
uniref:U-scoloptoxin(11)-Sm4a n=1 Tax=Scolopendra morsitans TaxID=943129 RepID=TXB4A_SCOMO|nr:RecName: Full=U-scoloptoxin(11)-Sm4a; Short=U-SLPTX(11)-Sm4a; Flags: Precursor [Scolopendra morsitans]